MKRQPRYWKVLWNSSQTVHMKPAAAGFLLSKTSTQEQKQLIAHYIKNPKFEIPDDLKELIYT
jgi:hypothetical protein